MAVDKWTPKQTDLSRVQAAIPGPLPPPRVIVDDPHPSAVKREHLRRTTAVDDAIIATVAAGEYRKAVPKSVLTARALAGVGPAAEYFLAASGAVPTGSSFHIHTILHLATQFDPNIAGSTDIFGEMFVLIDEEPIVFSSIQGQGSSVAALIAYDFAVHRVIEVDYFAAEDSVISILTHTDYNGGGAGAGMQHNVIVLGDLIEFDEDIMGRGTGELVAAPGATVIGIWNLVAAKYAL